MPSKCPDTVELAAIRQQIAVLEARRRVLEAALCVGGARDRETLRPDLAEWSACRRATRPGDPVSARPRKETVAATWEVEEFDVIERGPVFQTQRLA